MAVRLTDRDLSFFRWLNGFGFATVEQIARLWGVSVPFVYRRAKNLVDEGYLKYSRIFHGQPGVYLLSSQGAAIAGDDLQPNRNIRIHSYAHDLTVIDLSFRLLDDHGGEFIPERRIRRKKGLTGVGQRGHIADGELVVDGKCYAIEVELTNKGARRRKRIFDGYAKQLNYAEVWYFCSKQTLKAVEAAGTPRYRFVKVRAL